MVQRGMNYREVVTNGGIMKLEREILDHISKGKLAKNYEDLHNLFKRQLRLEGKDSGDLTAEMLVNTKNKIRKLVEESEKNDYFIANSDDEDKEKMKWFIKE